MFPVYYGQFQKGRYCHFKQSVRIDVFHHQFSSGNVKVQMIKKVLGNAWHIWLLLWLLIFLTGLLLYMISILFYETKTTCIYFYMSQQCISFANIQKLPWISYILLLNTHITNNLWQCSETLKTSLPPKRGFIKCIINIGQLIWRKKTNTNIGS